MIKKLEGIFLTSFLLMTFAAPFLVTFYYFYLFFQKKWVLNIAYNCVIDFILIYVLVLPSHNILNYKFDFCLMYFQEELFKKKKKTKGDVLKFSLK